MFCFALKASDMLIFDKDKDKDQFLNTHLVDLPWLA